jgi:hypothetical protein
MGIAKTTLLRYQNTLIKFGLIKNVTRGKSTTGHYKNNIYQVTPLEEIPGHRDIRYQNDTDIGSKMIPDRFQNDTDIGSKMKLSLVSKRYPNNTNPNNTNSTAANGENAAADFKKLKEKGEEKMQALREQLRDLDIKEEFIEQLLKEYSMKKIEKKLDLLMERRNIQNPAGWLRTALKNDYQGEEEEGYDEEPERQESQPLRIDSRFRGNDIKGSGNDTKANSDSSEYGNLVSPSEWTSREKALKAIKLIQDNLSACISSVHSGKRTRARENAGVRFIKPVKLRGG